jgi:RNA polymerase sigma-70 factor, ECF subfamily
MHAYQNMVYSTAARLVGDPAQAEDISQEVFLRAYDHFDDLQGSATAGGWLKTVARNLSLNHLTRYRKRWQFFSDRRDEEGEEETGPEFSVLDSLLDDVAAEERHRRIELALDQLPEHQRVPLVLFHFEDLSYQDIATRLRVSVAKIKIDIHRARTALTRLLGSEDVPQ